MLTIWKSKTSILLIINILWNRPSTSSRCLCYADTDFFNHSLDMTALSSLITELKVGEIPVSYHRFSVTVKENSAINMKSISSYYPSCFLPKGCSCQLLYYYQIQLELKWCCISLTKYPCLLFWRHFHQWDSLWLCILLSVISHNMACCRGFTVVISPLCCPAASTWIRQPTAYSRTSCHQGHNQWCV